MKIIFGSNYLFMKKMLTDKYRYFVLYLEIFMVILLIPITYNLVPVNEGNPTFYISSSNIDDVVETLKTNGYEVTWFDKMMLKFRKVPEEGWYSVAPHKYGRILFFQHLYKQKTNDLMDVIVYAGETKEELTARLSNDMKLDQQKLLTVYKTLARFEESDILAQRYSVARKADENATMKYIFFESERTLQKFLIESFTKIPEISELKNLHIIASIIQKESNSVDEMPLISSVIYNRMEKGMRLQMDGTLNYGKYSRTVVTPERIKSDTSLYNTYKRKGLPPNPICTICIDALKASIQPAENDYLFFMLDPTGIHNFSVTYDEHLKNIRTFRAYQKEKEKRDRSEENKVCESDVASLLASTTDENTTIH